MDSPFLLPGFNRNCISIFNNDGMVNFMSVIAYVLGSNCYIEGLTKINYMELATKQGLYTHTEGSFYEHNDIFNG